MGTNNFYPSFMYFALMYTVGGDSCDWYGIQVAAVIGCTLVSNPVDATFPHVRTVLVKSVFYQQRARVFFMCLHGVDSELELLAVVTQ